MAIEKRGKRFAVRVYLQGKHHYVGTRGTRAEARELERDALVAGKPASAITIQDFASRWPDSHPREKESTMEHYRLAARAFAAEFGSLRMRDIDRPTARAWAMKHRSRLGYMRAMFGDARRDGIVPENPFAELRIPRGKGRKELRILTPEELDKMADLALVAHGPEYGPVVRSLILFAAYTGLRPAEIYGLVWTDIDFSLGEIRVERQFHKRRTTLPKNGQARTVALPSPAAEALKQMPRTVGQTIVFPSKRGQRLDQPKLSSLWQPIKVAAGLPNYDFYSLRHTCATYLVERGVPAWAVAEQLGHKDGGRLVQKLYAHPAASLAREHVRRAFGQNVAELRPVDPDAIRTQEAG